MQFLVPLFVKADFAPLNVVSMHYHQNLITDSLSVIAAFSHSREDLSEKSVGTYLRTGELVAQNLADFEAQPLLGTSKLMWARVVISLPIQLPQRAISHPHRYPSKALQIRALRENRVA
jgi:hypothetical protein